MAEQTTVGELVYKISGDMDNLKTELAKAESEIGKLKGSMQQTGTASSSMAGMLSKAGSVVKAFAAAFVVKGIVDFGRAAVQVAGQQLEQQTKLYQVLRTSQNATDAQIQSLIAYSAELENVGVVSKDVTLASMAQLATYDLSTESIKELTPALLNYLVAEKGMNATKEDAIALTNGLAQAIQGNFTSLTRSGFILDEATKKTIQFGTQAERLAAITEVLDSTYKDYNKTLAGTFLGTQVRAQNILSDFRDDIGFALMPAVQNLTNYFIELAGRIMGTGENMQAGAERVNAMGKAFYKGSQFLIAFTEFVIATGKVIAQLGEVLLNMGKVVLAWAKDSSRYYSKLGDTVKGWASNFISNHKGAWDFAMSTFKGIGNAAVKLAGLLGKTLAGADWLTEPIKDMASNAIASLKSMKDEWVTENLSETTAAVNELQASWDKLGSGIEGNMARAKAAFDEGMTAANFKPVTAEALQAWDAMKKPVDSFGAAGEKAKESAKDLEKFQDKLLDIVKASQEVTKELQGELATSFKEFGDNVATEISDGTKGLAQIVVDARKKIADLDKDIAQSQSGANEDSLKARETLNDKIAAAELALSDRLRKIDETSKTAQKQRDEAQLLYRRSLADAQADFEKTTEGVDTSGSDKVAELKQQQAEQQKILDSAAGYAERQAAFITGLREKISGAGIDISTTGLDDILKAQSLQEQIDELNRRAELNDFQRFEEDQNKKLTILTNNFITEVTLLSQKIQKQKDYENDLTSFFIDVNAERLAETDSWAQLTIAKYGEVARALENIISLQAQAGQVASMNSAAAGQSNGQSQGIVNNSSVNSPITINAPGASGADWGAVAKQIAFQLGHQ